MKTASCDEGPQAYDRFVAAMRGIVQVPHATIQARVAAHKKETALNPHKRGPKAKTKPSA